MSKKESPSAIMFNTQKTKLVFLRFSAMLREKERELSQRVTAPAFLTVLMDAFEALEKCEQLNKAEQENATKSGSYMGLEVTYCVKHVHGKPTIYKVEEWEREGSTLEPLNEA